MGLVIMRAREIQILKENLVEKELVVEESGNGHREYSFACPQITELEVDVPDNGPDNLITEELELNLGPQHPSTHGVYRAVVMIDGELITSVDSHIGYLHRCFEKIAENRTYQQYMPFTDRMDYISSMLNNWGYAMAVEKLADIEVPERAEYIRVIVGELNRISSHLVYYTTAGLDTGALTPFFWFFEDREHILTLFEKLCGARQTYNYIRIGGVAGDLSEDWIVETRAFIEMFKSHFGDFEKILLGNYIFKERMVGVGVLSATDALKWGVAGPILRASGISYDVRKNDPYSVYPRLDFDVAVYFNGDNYDRTLVRFEEMRQSVRIIEQALDQIPDGPVMAEGLPWMLCPPPGEAFAHVESSRGDLGFYIESDGSPKPYRLKIQGPSFANLQAFPAIATNSYIADAIAILGTIDPVFGEVDR